MDHETRVNHGTPCDGCNRRQTCHSPCELLDRLLDSPYRGCNPWRERASLPLTEGRASFYASSPIGEEEEEELENPRTHPALLSFLPWALALLPDRERTVLSAIAASGAIREISASLRLSPTTVRRVHAAGLGLLRSIGKAAEKDRAGPVDIPWLPRADHESASRLGILVSNLRPVVIPISPSLALSLLRRNVRNRELVHERIAMYARDMKAGAWHLNNQGIAIGADGTLYDGQQRLCAVLQSGVTVPMLVVCGLHEDARSTIDCGRRRNLGEVCALTAGAGRDIRTASWIRAIAVFEGRKGMRFSAHDIRREEDRFRGSIEWLRIHGPKFVLSKKR